MRLTPDAMLTGMNADYLYGDNTVISKPPLAANPRAIAIANIFHTFLVHPTVMVNHSHLINSVLRYNEEYRHCEDFDLWRR